MKFLSTLCFFLLPLGLWASTLQEGSTFQAPLIKDQFEKTVQVTPQTKQIIIAYSQAQGSSLKTFLEANPNYLRENNALYWMDATAVPSMVMSMFMMPKFKKYPYAIGLLEDEKALAYFPKKEDHLTIIELDNLVVKKISFKESF
ncbi:hypothetical protein [Sulfurospirillum deleyianum]|uniref:FAD/FMN-containing dehydrogenase n=1 Tax=Sulfurospirillum deleyianum (strain ATCC 51133 / DSM 6946 / 5175) TaxID=525898 RepID=D1AZN6_SULD5|nr:hypothetical protein [Sulfurospirillum deleyianum]ACZ11503.1 conserved hypothetical protein [Sulfurospirillum deleyianum DSM 6946]